MAEYIDREKIFPNGVFYVSAENPESSLNELINRICNLPTADVAPKSEVERLQAEVDQLHALLECGVFANSVEDWQKFLNEKRAEVAREIFEEIEKFIVRRMIADRPLIDDRLITDIAELKKKYQEGE